MENRMKRIIAILMTLTILFGCLIIPVSAEESYPFIFVHGFMGWGSDSEIEVNKPYWGDTQENNVMTYLRNKGYEVYNPSVSPLASAWDRACELYAQLTGTVVDYGEAHSKKYGHDRYGRDYTGKAIMGEAWDMETALNLVGHSYGGATVRVFAGLLAYGDTDEIAASGSNCSELFKGGHKNLVYSITTLAAPTNGSTLSDFAANFPPVTALMCYYFTAKRSTGLAMDPMLDQWGLTAPDGEEAPKVTWAKVFKIAFSNDHCGYDMSVKGALEINERFPTIDSVYYFSYYGNITKENSLGFYTINTETTVFNMFTYTAPVITYNVGHFSGGIWIDKGWGESDGMVSLKSAMYPYGDASEHCNYADATEIKPGIWYVMTELTGVDHYDFCSAAESGEFGSKAEYFAFYEKLIENVYGI